VIGILLVLRPADRRIPLRPTARERSERKLNDFPSAAGPSTLPGLAALVDDQRNISSARAAPVREAIDRALTRLNAQFPDLPQDAIRSVFGDSYRLVVDVSGQPLVDKAEELTRLRLEMRTRHPAVEAGTG
jgi:hypothetical protein